MKMSVGHHGANHPVVNLRLAEYLSRLRITVVVDEERFKEIAEITHRSLFDGTIQGYKLKNSSFRFSRSPRVVLVRRILKRFLKIF